MARFPLLSDVLAARHRLRGVALHTPLERSPTLADESGSAEVRLKLELLQPTGAFKIRGAFNKVALIAAATPDARLVTASQRQPRHRRGQRRSARYGMRLTVLVPAAVSPAKLERLRALESDDCVVEVFGRDIGRRRDRGSATRRPRAIAVYVPPYNDPDVIAGPGNRRRSRCSRNGRTATPWWCRSAAAG